jgi:glutaryl-CoA dehydrogenase
MATHQFQGTDFYGMDSLLTEEEIQVRGAVRAWVSSRFMPVVDEHVRGGTFPMELVPELGELGVFGANLAGYGCAGLGQVAYGLIMQELERGDSGLRSFGSVQGSLVMYPIHTWGSDEQKERWLPRLARGEAIGCFGLTEPDAGSDPGSMRTVAVREGGGFRLRGAKMWITNGTVADVAVVWAKLDGVVHGFLVEKGMPGYTAPETHGKFSLRASVTSELIFDDVRLPASAVLPRARGLGAPLSCLNQARYGIAWGALGAAMACYEEALQYSQERIQFGKPIASFQLVQQKLVYMVNEITKGQLLALQLGRLKERGEATPARVSLAKRNNVHQALEIARMARDVLGAAGIVDAHQAGRHMCNLESVYTYEGTHDIHTLIVGAAITGIEAYR